MEKTRDTGLESWLDELAAQSLPGGVSAAALASAMGAALLAKTARVTLGRQTLAPGNRGRVDKIAAQARVELLIYDVRGRCITRLFEGELEAGAHEIPWNGRTAEGETAAPGVYFCRLTAQGATDTKRFVVLR